ncbi:hypothetical protein [Haloarcula amylovorans]|uniref:hypothetical protein n=1 Tax=Haloarcula amylovorans TaxID=2562280 RepID=UPI0010765047|nr:hypothetical protein [Halomicroarcula amylolytica]
MTGKYGSLVAYIRAYNQYGGKPPIPEFADVERGEPRPKWHWRALFIPTALLALVPVVVIGSRMNPPLTTPGVAALSLAWFGLVFTIASMLTQPFSDWLRDVPRYGLNEIDATIAPTTEVADD